MAKLELEHQFDVQTCRHYFEGTAHVFHCHHYATLYCQLAEDADEMFGGIALLVESARDVLAKVLANYFQKHKIADVAARVKVAEDYWFSAGMGLLKIGKCEEGGGEAEIEHSHVEEGWLKKFGSHDKPVDFITQGYLAGAFASIFDKPLGTFTAKAEESVVTGAPKTRYTVLQG